MAAYLLKLLIMLPLVGALAWGALWLGRRAQSGQLAGWMARADAPVAAVRVVDAVPLGIAARLAVVEFDGRTLLIAVTKQGVTPIAAARGAADGA
ncbi:MAG: hypothetical protein RLZZ58_973 [Pseudomonadota bacterium]